MRKMSAQHWGKYLVGCVRPRSANAGKSIKLLIMSIHRNLLSVFCLLLAGCSADNPAPASGDQFQSTAAGLCVEDKRTDLTWEVKTDTSGLHDWRNTYTWFNPDEAQGELDYRGLQDGGECGASRCDTTDFVRAVNEAGHCGFNDWRMPSRNELMSISDLGRAENPPTANREFFPFMQADEYWTGYDYAMQYESAWAWNFFYGHDRVDWKRTAKFVRLVRGKSKELEEVKE